MLILFDVDGTLLVSDGAGRAAMELAGQELFGPSFTCDPIDFGGKVDCLIWLELCEINAVSPRDGDEERFRDAFARHLERCFAGDRKATPLPGVPPLLEALEAEPDVVVGVLSGNYPVTGRMKVDAAGLRAERFAVQSWGIDVARRPDLVPRALEEFARIDDRTLAPQQVVIVGDTPDDVACAREHGCRSLAVRSGYADHRLLDAAGADLVLDDLSDTAAVLRWLRS